MFAKETFDYPELEEHPLLCNHLGKIYLVNHIYFNFWKSFKIMIKHHKICLSNVKVINP